MSNHYDVIVIGGGINGAGIARDVAGRGMKVLLLEKNDFGSGTSSWSSRLIHGGLRYLEYGEFPLVFESLRERRTLQRIAPHLVTRLALTIPVYASSKRGLWLVRLGMLAYDLLSIGKAVPHHRMQSAKQIEAAIPALNQQGLKGGARYFDAQVTFAERLVIENIIAARESGAEVKNYSPVIGINIKNNAFQNIHYIDRETGTETEATASVLVNAAGPWVDRVLATVNREVLPFMGGTKGSHIVVDRFAGAPKDAVYAEARADGRPFFIIPWNEQILIGTTDIRYDGDPAKVSPSVEEVDYLLAEANLLFPHISLTRQDVHYAYAGVRPLPRAKGGPESAITRKHIIEKHKDSMRGVVSIIGGKLTTFRNLARQVADYTGKKSGVETVSFDSSKIPLPGGIDIDGARKALQKIPTLSDNGVRRLLKIYGGRALTIAELTNARPEYAASLDSEATVLAAEIVHNIRNEFARNLIDIVQRRMMIGLAANRSVDLIEPVAEVAATELSWSDDEKLLQIAALHEYNKRFEVPLPPIADA